MRLHQDREPCHWSAGLRPGAIASLRMLPAPGRRPALRFMDSLVSLLRMHRDHEPCKAPASRTHSERFAKAQALGHCAAAFGVRGACSRFRTRFMESLKSLFSTPLEPGPD